MRLRLFPLLTLLLSAPTALPAQAWNAPAATALVERAVQVRQAQSMDTLLVDYTADAIGKLIFQVKVGEGFPTPPVTVKATEVAVKVYWAHPGRSKQVIVGMRDTLLLPGNIGYYQDRYGIVQNNLPDIIRLGDGRDVRDVPHPISSAGLREYDFALTDSLRVTLPLQVVDVYEVSVRPRNPRESRVVGSVYIDRESAALVRMSFTFTRAALIDKRNESLSIMLENALINGRFWLPLRQELHLTRSDALLDFPANSIIRASWRICCYDVNVALPPANFVGPEIVRSSAGVLNAYTWEQNILDVLPPDIRILTPEQVRTIQNSALELVQARALTRATGGQLSVRRVSDFVRANRVEGLAGGAGARLHLGAGVSLSGTARYGLSDDRLKGRLSAALQRPGGAHITLYGEREYSDAVMVQERSLAVNSIAAPLFGSDYTALYDNRTIGATVDWSPLGIWRPRTTISSQRHAQLRVWGSPLSGTFADPIPADAVDMLSLSTSLSTATAAGYGGAHLRIGGTVEIAYLEHLGVEHAGLVGRMVKTTGELEAGLPLGSATLAVTSHFGTIVSDGYLPRQLYLRLGGPRSAPGYEFGSFAAKLAATTRAELQLPIPFPSIGLGRYGRSPARATIAPWGAAALIGGSPVELGVRPNGIYPSVGVGGEFLFGLLRMDVARGLRDGRWTFSADIMKALWGVL